MGARPSLALLLRLEQEHFAQIERRRRFEGAHPDILICYDWKSRGWAAAWRAGGLISAHRDLSMLMDALEAVGWITRPRKRPESRKPRKGMHHGRHRRTRSAL